MAQNNQAIAQIGLDWFVSKTGEKRPDFDRYNPYSKMLKVAEARRAIAPEVAQTFQALSKAGTVPPWVYKMLGDKLDLIKLATE